MRFRHHVDRLTGRLSDEERSRLVSHAFAIGVVAAAMSAGLVASDAAPPFALLHAAVALSAFQGGWWPAVVATLASVLASRVGAEVRWIPAMLFSLEALVIAAVVIRLNQSRQLQRRQTIAADARIRELKASERQGRIFQTAFNRLQESSTDIIVAILGDDGRIAEWGMGAERLYARPSDSVLGTSARALFNPPLAEEEFAVLLSRARSGIAQCGGRHSRADGTSFEADVEIRALFRGRFGGFTMVVHDRSRQREWEAFAQSAEDVQTTLREEGDVAQRQLAALRHVTDPSLDALSGEDVVTTLLDRLRPTVDADGVALVPVGSPLAPASYASSGIRGHHNPVRVDVDRHLTGHTLLIHNDAARVSEMSAVKWPGTVVSLIAVPVIREGAVQAVLEVVNTRSRRSTEWDIALIQVVAARMAGSVSGESVSTLRGQHAIDHLA